MQSSCNAVLDLLRHAHTLYIAIVLSFGGVWESEREREIERISTKLISDAL